MLAGKVSIIIRSRNEEDWIKHCLISVFSQSYRNYEVILVDNCSEDNTLSIAKTFPLTQIVHISDYSPGGSLNAGIEHSNGEYIVCLSSHCVPEKKDWLERLVLNMSDSEAAAAYGRQIPVTFSDPHDVRDLVIAFGLDRREQRKDPFFHNANSILRRSLWGEEKFDSTVSNIEDRLWAKKMIERGLKIIYDPEAAVFHHHGIHHGKSRERARTTVEIISETEQYFSEESIPYSMRPESLNIVCICPVTPEVQKSLPEYHPIEDFLAFLYEQEYVKSSYVITNDADTISKANDYGIHTLNRNPEYEKPDYSLQMLLQSVLRKLDASELIDAVLYMNPSYPFRSAEFLNILIEDFAFKGLDSCFAGYCDYQSSWYFDAEEGYISKGEKLVSRKNKQPDYRAIYGLGCISKASYIRSGMMIGEKVGIIPLHNPIYTLKITDKYQLPLINLLKEQSDERLYAN